VAERETDEPSTPGTAWSRSKEHWLAAMRWRREVEEALSPLGLTFTRWLVLEAARDKIVETDDAVSQTTVATHCELDKATVSQVMASLEKDGLVDRGPDLSTRGYRVILTQKGHGIAERAATLVAHISLRFRCRAGGER
jgi:DNA-binding MarR family transcriptional regulator